MTNDPYPPDLEEVESRTVFSSTPIEAVNPQVVALNRIAVALEQLVLATLDKPQNAPQATLAALPPVRPAQAQNGGVCPIHGTPWRTVPAGVSKKTGNAYEAFQACSTTGCDQRPPR